MAAALRGLRATLPVPSRLLGTAVTSSMTSSGAMTSSGGAPPSSPLSRPFETLRVTRGGAQGGGHVLHVRLHRPEKRNALSGTMWRELIECFQAVAQDPSSRAVVISGAGKAFTAGIDLVEMGGEFMAVEGEDPARRAWNLRRKIQRYQESFTVLEQCPKPVIAAVHGACVGAGVDLISACDIRFCTQDAWFQIKEVDIGLAADVGTLQRLPKIVGSQSLVNELAFTARKMMAPEARSCGLVSRVFPDLESLLEGALEVAEAIAARSPVAVQGTKINLVYGRDHPVPEALRYMATWNMAMLQTEDLLKSAQAALEKKGPEGVPFAKL